MCASYCVNMYIVLQMYYKSTLILHMQGAQSYPTIFIRSKCVVIKIRENKYAAELPNFKNNLWIV